MCISQAAKAPIQPTSSERRYVISREMLSNLEIKGLMGLVKMKPARSKTSSSSSPIMLMTDIDSKIDSLRLVDMHSQGNARCDTLPPVLSLGPVGWGLNLHSTLSESLMTPPRLVSVSTDVGVGPYRLRVGPLNLRVSGQGLQKVLWQSSVGPLYSERHHQLMQIITGILPVDVKDNEDPDNGNDDGLEPNKMVMSYVSLLTSKNAIDLEYVHPDEPVREVRTWSLSLSAFLCAPPYLLPNLDLTLLIRGKNKVYAQTL